MKHASLSPADQQEVTRYREVSRLAILGLVLGALSPLALLHPLWWSVPLVAVVLCVVALAMIARRPAELTGRRMALWGLALALFFGSWSAGQTALRNWVLRWQAEQVADHWLSLWQQGELEAMHQLTVSATERRPPEADLQAFYQSTPQLRATLTSFYATEPPSWLKRLDQPQSSIRPLGTEFQVRESPTEEQFVVAYDIIIPQGGSLVEHRVRVHVARKVWPGLGLVDWYVSDCTTPERSAAF